MSIGGLSYCNVPSICNTAVTVSNGSTVKFTCTDVGDISTRDQTSHGTHIDFAEWGHTIEKAFQGMASSALYTGVGAAASLFAASALV